MRRVQSPGQGWLQDSRSQDRSVLPYPGSRNYYLQGSVEDWMSNVRATRATLMIQKQPVFAYLLPTAQVLLCL